MRIILASESVARKNFLDILGLEFEAIPSNLDEKTIRHENPRELARLLSEAKAKAVGEAEKGLIVAGDMFVVFEGKILEKPKDETEAMEMLTSFSGNELEIVAGVAVYNSETQKMVSKTETGVVKFRDLSKDEIKDYMARFPVLKYSGAFDWRGLIRFTERAISGYPFMFGYPMNILVLALREHGLNI